MNSYRKMAESAVRPWDSPDSVSEFALDAKGNIQIKISGLGMDPNWEKRQEEIDICLNCPYDHCTNCLERHRKKTVSKAKKTGKPERVQLSLDIVFNMQECRGAADGTTV